MRSLDIAVVIVTYKSAELTVDSLRSLEGERKEAGLSIRVLVVDNASGDLPYIEQAVGANGWAGWVDLICADRNGGFAYGNNVGIERAYGDGAPDYVYLLNPDAQVRPKAITTLVRFMEENPSVGIAGSSFETLDGSDWPMAFRFPSLVSEFAGGLDFGVVSRLLNRWVVAREMQPIRQPVDWICGASMLIRPAVFSRIGGMDENYFLYFEETDFCRRAKRAGFETWYVPESRVMHIMGQSTKVTEIVATPRRFPSYWFESRRRYFSVTFGLSYAMATDIVAVLAAMLGYVKRIAQGRRRGAVPYYIRDLLRYSILWKKNRTLDALKCFRPQSGEQ